MSGGAIPSVRHIWRDELENGMDYLQESAAKYNYICVSTLWPGFVSRPITYEEYAYVSMRDTVSLTDVLQIAFSFADARSKKTQSVIQFNFVYHVSRMCIVQETMDALITQGFDHGKAQTNGIDPQEFGECLLGTGLLMRDDINWCSYHGIYDFGFLLKALTNCQLPAKKDEFMSQVTEYFPRCYDAKYMLSRKLPRNEVPDGLRAAGKVLGLGHSPLLTNPNAANRAAINAALVQKCFQNILAQYYNNKLDETKFAGHLYGLEDIEEAKLPPGMLRLKPGTYASPTAAQRE